MPSDLDERTRKAWTRFVNGLKLAGPERIAILQMVRALHARVQLAEQARWNAEHYLELCVRMARHKILMGIDDGE